MNKKTELMLETSNKILELIDNDIASQVNRSDLQGIIEAISLNVINQAQKLISL